MMRVVKLGLVACAAALFANGMASAAVNPPAPPTGVYALDADSCKVKDYFLTLRKDRLDLPVFSCIGLAWDQLRDASGTTTWQVDGTRCQGEHAGRPGPKRFRIENTATSARIFWPDGTRSAAFLRCGPVR